MCIRDRLNPNNSTCFASFGAHPNFQVALERTVTELLQGRSLKDLDVFSPPSFNNDDVAEHANLETHFIDSVSYTHLDVYKRQQLSYVAIICFTLSALRGVLS